MRLFERFDLGRDAAQVVHVVVAVLQTALLVCVDLEALAAARGADRQRLVVQVYVAGSPSIAAKTAARNSPLTVIGSSPLLRALLRKMSAKKLDTTTRNP